MEQKKTVRRFAVNVRDLEYLTPFTVGRFCLLGTPFLLAANSLALQLAQVDTRHLTTLHIKETVRRFSANVRQLEYLTSFSVGGFCQLGKPLLLGMLAVVRTYFVVLYQLGST